MNTVFIFLAESFEEIETLTVVDVLRRGEMDVRMVSITNDRNVTGAHGITVVADCLLKEVDRSSAVCLICPGGMPGAQYLSENKDLMGWLQEYQQEQKGWMAAICAAPALVFGKLNFERRYRLTCYPGFESVLAHQEVLAEGVVVDGRVITAKGPAFAMDFGLAILTQLTSEAKALEVAGGMLK